MATSGRTRVIKVVCVSWKNIEALSRSPGVTVTDMALLTKEFRDHQGNKTSSTSPSFAV